MLLVLLVAFGSHSDRPSPNRGTHRVDGLPSKLTPAGTPPTPSDSEDFGHNFPPSPSPSRRRRGLLLTMTGPTPRLPVWRGAPGARVGGRLAVALVAATVLVLAASGAGAPAAEHAQGPVGTFTERFAVELHPGADPDAVARELHMENLGQVRSERERRLRRVAV